MKKLQLLFAIAAFLTASVAVYATEFAFATVYYEDTAAAGDCNMVINLPCNEGSVEPCLLPNGNRVFKIVDEGEDCVQVKRIE